MSICRTVLEKLTDPGIRKNDNNNLLPLAYNEYNHKKTKL